VNRLDRAKGSFQDVEAEVLRARLSFEEDLREASLAGTRAARRVLTPAVIGLGLAGGALLALALYRLARRPAADGALIRIVIEPPRTPRKLLPAIGSALARWVIERQLRGGGPLAMLGTLAGQSHAARGSGAHDGSGEVGRFGGSR
jgi:hypothetical protein